MVGTIKLTIRRICAFRRSADKVPPGLVANSEGAFPSGWLNAARDDVTDECIKYAAPLIGNDRVSAPLENGIMRFARMKPLFAEIKLPAYVPQGYRK